MASKHQGQLKYGELVLLGYNGQLPQGNRGRKRSKFILYQRRVANGVKPFQNSFVKTTDLSNRQSNTHCITYTMPEQMAAVTEYGKDNSTDMFQIGRSGSSSIDFVLFDTPATSESMSTISRFACRIVVDRNYPNVARIYAAGFNESNTISLGESALKWKKEDGSMDGLTTNGVLIVHPTGVYCAGDSDYGCWRELSVAGDLYSLRQDKRSRDRGKIIHTENNVLKDGTLINLCGATLLWRSAEGLATSPSTKDVEKLVLTINEDWNRIITEDLNVISFAIRRLPIPRVKSDTQLNKLLPYVHVGCGHVQCYRECDFDQTKQISCQACNEASIAVSLYMGLEPSFYVDDGPPAYAFNPCGHMATEKTVKFWASVAIPEDINSFISQCPFCAAPLDDWPGYIELKFSFLLNGTL